MSLRTISEQQVAGLHVREWSGAGTTVLCLPGLGSSGASWGPLADALPEARILAPDLRGRGMSQGKGGATGLLAHALDLQKLAEELDLHDAVVIGHSMGAYLAPLVAQELGDRVSRLVLVDGGIPPKFPFFLGPGLTRLAFTKRLRTMDRDWPDVETMARKAGLYKNLASRPDLIPVLLQILEQQMGGRPGALHPRLDVAHAVADAVDAFFGPEVRRALEALTVPTEVFLAQNKMKPGEKPFIADAAVDPWAARLPCLTVTRLPGNHITVVFAPEVVQAVGS